MGKQLKLAWLLCSLTLATGSAYAADQQDEESDSSVRNCVSTNRIRTTKVVDDSNILFYMRGGTIYHNRLSRGCNGLGREGRFSYRARGGNLCQMDTITVLYSGGLTGFNRGASCSLGYFNEITEEDAEGIIEGPPKDQEAKPLPPAEPEDMSGETEES
jgi:hypothetical protein